MPPRDPTQRTRTDGAPDESCGGESGQGEAGPGAAAEPDAGKLPPRPPVPEWVRRALSVGFSGFFFTEEAIRKALGDTMPRDWADFAADQSSRARAEFLERLSYEIGRALENLDYATVLAQLLEGRTLEVNASIRLREDEGRKRRPQLRVDVSRREDE